MAISAYRQGKLKKNPLLGTSLASDPGKAQERKEFMSLYGEARSRAGEGRAGMVRRLSERYQKFGQPHVARMGELDKQRSDLAAIGDSASLVQARRGLETAEGREAQIAELPYFGGDASRSTGMVGWAHARRTGSQAPLRGLSAGFQSELARARTEQARNWKDWSWDEGDIPGRRKVKHAKDYTAGKTKGARTALGRAQTAERSVVAKRQAQIGGLTELYNKRRGILQERASRYNRFLGA